MAYSPSNPATPPVTSDLDPANQPPPPVYWCYHCDKRVSVDTGDYPDALTCRDCKHGFVESIASTPPLSPSAREPHLDSHFLHVLRLVASDEDAPPPPPPTMNSAEGDFLRIHLDTFADDVAGGDEDGDDEGEQEIRRGDVLRLRLQDLASRASDRRARILDWAEILMGLEDNSIQMRLQMDGAEGYAGDPEDYADAAGYEALLRDLAESEGRRGAPPASREAILGLEDLEIKSVEDLMQCAVCKDGIGMGHVAKKLPCGHGYHKDCIVPWLGSRNTCPVCRYELETDDLEYESGRNRATGPSSSSRR